MDILSYVLIIFLIACAPTEETDSPNPGNQAQTTTKPDNVGTPENSLEEPAETPAPIAEPAPPQNQEPLATPPEPTEIQLILSQLHGLYEFDLDVYQNWSTHWRTMFYTNARIFMNLAQNPRPGVEQLLIEVISDSDGSDTVPIGKFCVVQSQFELQNQENANKRTSRNAKALSALNSTANSGGIIDINNIKNTIKIDTYEPIDFTMEFYGDHGGESVSFQIKTSENITQDFDSLCQFCGFEIGKAGLCQ